jgi:hypothetical protein
MKKYILMPYGYEYNDNTYDRDGFQLDEARHFDTAKEANEARLTMAKERCPELESSYGGVMNCIDWDTRKKVVDIFEEEDSYGFSLDFDSMTDEEEEEVLRLVAPFVYEIVEIDTEKDSAQVKYEDDGYSTMTYNMKLNEENQVVMHSLEGPAFTRHWDDYPEDNEDNDTYYINGEKMSKEEWTMRRREHKIDQVVD